MCLYKRIVKNPKYKENKKNAGIVPHFSDIRVLSVPIKCGRCAECMKSKANEWKIRLYEEIKGQELTGHMVTLTVSENKLKYLHRKAREKTPEADEYEIENLAMSIAVRRFTESWRKEHKKSIRHWLITELGQNNTERIHIHGIVWTNEDKNKIQKHWKWGKVWAGYEGRDTYVTEKTVNYIIKYVTKLDEKHRYYIPKIYASKGIGANWTKG